MSARSHIDNSSWLMPSGALKLRRRLMTNASRGSVGKASCIALAQRIFRSSHRFRSGGDATHAVA
ncbi:MAG: hypothetical protein WKF84_09845 [Pyrinomonadaceae bacterium]